MKEEALSNYLPVNRKFFNHPFWTEKRQYSKSEAWLDLIREARFDESEARELIGGKMVKWNRGELPVSLRYLSERWQWSRQKVDDFLKLLVSEGMIQKRTAEKTGQTIITLCNYISYNGSKNKKGQQKGRENDSGMTAKGQGDDKTNIDNIDKESKEDIGDKSPAHSPDEENGFKNFQQWILEHAPEVAKMEEPFTIKQYLQLKLKYPNSQQIRELLTSMHNWRDLRKKNKSAYYTIMNWKRRDERRGQ